MPTGDAFPLLIRALGRAQSVHVTVEFFFQFVFQYHAADGASIAFDFRSHFLIKPVEFGIVGQFLGLHNAILERLTFSQRDFAAAKTACHPWLS